MKYIVKEKVNGEIITHKSFDTYLQASNAIEWDEAIYGSPSPLYIEKVEMPTNKER